MDRVQQTTVARLTAQAETLVPTRRRRSRGWLVRRVLLLADLIGLVAAFVVAQLFLGDVFDRVNPDVAELFVFFLISLPAWAVAAKLYGLYDRDEERTDHSTSDDVVGVFHLVTVGAWILYVGARLTEVTTPNLEKTALFWALAILFITVGRALGRSLVRRSASYVQNAVVVGGGQVGQLVARKYLLHPEYGIRLLGVVDDDPLERRDELQGIEIWPTDRLLDLVQERQIDRVVFAFSQAPHEHTLSLIRGLRELNVQIDLVPRLYEVLPPNVDVHSVEGLALLSLRPLRISRSSRFVKRSLDVVGASLLLLLTAPLFALFAWRIRRDSPGPVFFRQTRLGQDMKEFTALKFRTMTDARHDGEHLEYVQSIMSSSASVGDNGLYKLERPDAVTKTGRWLRKTSLDELPQLVNVLRGDMSLVGPRPCIPYETELFGPHHFERFLVPAGLTGLWQVTARSRATFGEALDLDVAYARGWSLGLDLRLLARTPLQLFRDRGGTR
ncbi:MAG: exopolysaccharide biosynthesis polyprenyl glycosylphosphotransferase [Gaiellaceae bacterium MAG52_C11]|nr:exopolysaccharide biosynthesis polyprenyl glycosylphosphotransferase [Candidatus Gaiellasilicea maunaloa]